MQIVVTSCRGRVASRGRLQIPADVRKELGLADGADVRLEVVDGELRVRTFASALQRVRAIARAHLASGVSMAEELIADR